ncbi:hypothetical protein Tco_1284257 [Tanacetum coccineum]
MLGRNGIWELMELADDGVRGLDEDEEFYSRTFHRPNSPLTNLHQHLEKIFQLLRRTFYFNLYHGTTVKADTLKLILQIPTTPKLSSPFPDEHSSLTLEETSIEVDELNKHRDGSYYYHIVVSRPGRLDWVCWKNGSAGSDGVSEAFVFAVLGVILFGAAFGYWLVRKYIVSDDEEVNAGIESIADSTLQLAGVKATVLCAWFCRVSYLGNGGRTRSTNYMSELVISGGREFPYVVESIMKKSATITFGKEEIAAFFIWFIDSGAATGFKYEIQHKKENLHGVNNSENEVVIEDDASSSDESTTEDESSDEEQCPARHVGILDETPRGSKYWIPNVEDKPVEGAFMGKLIIIDSYFKRKSSNSTENATRLGPPNKTPQVPSLADSVESTSPIPLESHPSSSFTYNLFIYAMKAKTLVVMIFIICCLAANSGRMAEYEYCLPQQPP